MPNVILPLKRLYWRALATRHRQRLRFSDSSSYWRTRYASGGDSGAGSYGKFALFKASVLNRFVEANLVGSVIEFGCGDGNQLSLYRFLTYLGFDVSDTAVRRCRERFAGDASRQFKLLDDYDGETAELALSIDVIFHLVEDQVFDDYMRRLFGAATRFVIVYSSDTDHLDDAAPHVRHRKFSRWIESNCVNWKRTEHIPNIYPYTGDATAGSPADFFVFQRID